MNPQQYLTANRAAILNNIICFYLWKNETPSEHIRKTAEHAAGEGVPYNTAKDYLTEEWNRVITSKEHLTALITELRQRVIKPHYKNNHDYIIKEYETEPITTVEALFNRIGGLQA